MNQLLSQLKLQIPNIIIIIVIIIVVLVVYFIVKKYSSSSFSLFNKLYVGVGPKNQKIYVAIGKKIDDKQQSYAGIMVVDEIRDYPDTSVGIIVNESSDKVVMHEVTYTDKLHIFAKNGKQVEYKNPEGNTIQ